MGSRSWSECAERAAEAARAIPAPPPVGDRGEILGRRVDACPHAPEVLSLAARSELLRRFDLPGDVDEHTDLTKLEERALKSRALALGWMSRAEHEWTRRGEHIDPELAYWRGKALMAAGELAAAKGFIEQAHHGGGMSGWRVRRLLGLIALYRGDLEDARRLAHRAMIDSPANNNRGDHQVISGYVLAIVLDRSDDVVAARRMAQRMADRDRDRGAMRGLMQVLPMHEQLYFAALHREAMRDYASAAGLWRAYLARKEPEAPDRKVAERHLEHIKKRQSGA